MILDNALSFDTAFDISGAAATNLTSANSIDLGSVRDIGSGEPLRVVFQCVVAPVIDTGTPNVEFIVFGASDAAFTTNLQFVARSALFGAALHVGGAYPRQFDRFELILPPATLGVRQDSNLPPARYLEILYIARNPVAANFFVVGTGIFQIYMTHTSDDEGRIYPASLDNAT